MIRNWRNYLENNFWSSFGLKSWARRFFIDSRLTTKFQPKTPTLTIRTPKSARCTSYAEGRRCALYSRRKYRARKINIIIIIIIIIILMCALCTKWHELIRAPCTFHNYECALYILIINHLYGSTSTKRDYSCQSIAHRWSCMPPQQISSVFAHIFMEKMHRNYTCALYTEIMCSALCTPLQKLICSFLNFTPFLTTLEG